MVSLFLTCVMTNCILFGMLNQMLMIKKCVYGKPLKTSFMEIESL